MNLELKKATFVAIGAFVLSFLIGLFSGSSFLFLLFRAVLLAGLFFGLTLGLFYLIREFLPELLGEEGKAPDALDESPVAPEMGGRVNISVGDSDEMVSGEETAQLVEAFPPDAAEEIKTLDQPGEEGYTEPGDSKIRGNPDQEGSVSGKTAAVPPELIDGVDVLPDLEGFSDSFTSPLVQEAVAEENGGIRPVSSSSSPAFRGKGSADFDVKEMASAIQTILKRDQKG